MRRGLVLVNATIGVLMYGACDVQPRSGIDDLPAASVDSTVVEEWLGRPVIRSDVVLRRGGEVREVAGIKSAVFGESGQVVLSEARTAQVLIADSTGEIYSVVGGQGSGPGEFRHVSWLGMCGPGIVFVWDGFRGQMSVVDIESGVVGRRFQFRRADGSQFRVGKIACSRTGTLAVLGSPDFRIPRLSGPIEHANASLVISNDDGTVIHDLGVVPAAEPVPVGKATQFAVGPRHLVYGTAQTRAIHIVAFDGQVVDSVTATGEGRAVTRQNLHRAASDMVEDFVDADERLAAYEMVVRGRWSPTTPFYSGVFAVGDNKIWVVTSTPGDLVTRLEGFAGGNAIGEIVLRGDYTVHDKTTDGLLVSQWNDDRETLVVIRPVRGGNQP